MGYIIGLAIMLVIISIIIPSSIEDVEEDKAFAICMSISTVIIILAYLFATSNFIASTTINNYKKGEYKEIIIIEGQDTTYKYVYKCKE